MSQGFQKNRLLAALPAETFEALERSVRPISLLQGAVIYHPGQPMETIYFPLSGLFSLTIVTQSGSGIEAAIVGREGAVGLHVGLGKRYSFTRATMQIGGICASIATSRFAQITKSSFAVQDLVLRYREALLAEAQQTTACNAIHDAGSRLCRWLLQSADHVGSDHLPLTQEFFAQLVGVRRTTITLLAQMLKNNGMIKYSRGHIVIHDRSQLEAGACECYHILRAREAFAQT